MTVTRERMTRLDARQYSYRIEFIFGRLRVPSRTDFVEALLRIAQASPIFRIASVVTPDRRFRVRDPRTLREWAEGIVDCVPGDGLAWFVDGFAERAAVPPDGSLMRFTLTDHHVIFSGDHSLGDNGMLMRMAPAVIAVANGAPIPAWLMCPEPKFVLARALWHTFGRHPLQLRAALATRGPAWEAAEKAGTRPWRPAPTVSVATLSSERFSTLRRAYKGQSSRVPATIAMIMLARNALEAESIEVSPQSWIPIDSRRYLPGGIDPVGNFGADILVSSARGATAVDMAEQLASCLESGRPLLPMSWDSLQPLGPLGRATEVSVRPRADVSVVTLPLRQEVNALPWIDRDEARLYATGPDPDPVAIRCGILPTRSGATVTASYHSNVFPREKVEAALARLAVGDIDELLDPLELNAAS